VRIVAGEWRGRTIRAPAGKAVRPTLDRVREAWMSILQPQLPGARVLDLFAGSGALGLEALSRGAESVDFVDDAAASVRLITRNVEGLGAGGAARVHRADGLRFLEGLDAGAYDVAFVDPPYAVDAAVRVAERWLAVPFAELLGVEHASSTKLPAGGQSRRYGITSITFYRRGA